VSVHLEDGQLVSLSPMWAPHLHVRDELVLATEVEESPPEVKAIAASANGKKTRELYQVKIRHAAKAKQDSRQEWFIRAHTVDPKLGIAAVQFRGEAIAEYFYRAGPEGRPLPSFYTALGVAADCTPAELRLAYKVRVLELLNSPPKAGERRQA